MNPVRASLRYPQVTLALTIMLVASGVYALLRMPRREDPKIHVRIGRGGRESGHSESRAASLQNRGCAAGKDVLDKHERSHVYQPEPGRQPSGHGEVLVQTASRHGGAEEDGSSGWRGRPYRRLRLRRHGRGTAGDSWRTLRLPRVEGLC